jgi:hypothetical protein
MGDICSNQHQILPVHRRYGICNKPGSPCSREGGELQFPMVVPPVAITLPRNRRAFGWDQFNGLRGVLPPDQTEGLTCGQADILTGKRGCGAGVRK